MSDTVSPFFPPAGEVAYFLPRSDFRFMSLAIWSERSRAWVPLLFSDKRELVAGVAARAADGGFDYWVIPLEFDDEARELAEWRAMPAPRSEEFHSMLGLGFHAEGDPNR